MHHDGIHSGNAGGKHVLRACCIRLCTEEMPGLGGDCFGVHALGGNHSTMYFLVGPLALDMHGSR